MGDVNEVFVNIHKKKIFFGGGGRRVRGGGGLGKGGQGECVQRIEKMGGGGILGWEGGQGGCKRRIEVFVKIQKKKIWRAGLGGSGWGGVRVDVNEELKFL